ncbi:leucine-rich repeat protein kinase family protein [Actinidia rufa]|uniref:Leucine-rich repeat protein kinase family protein n=1 Tax=Actinidia rufa TaxID=165716 RepID=A0A7J0FNI4_9ERIC|nr:leucine-rich repeat protein kinase family protein [Actinidia rufa]
MLYLMVENSNWNLSTPICTSWVGINCSSDGTRVLGLRLPGVGLAGPIPANSLGKLDALMVLSLRSNGLNGNLPSDIPSLPSLHYLFLQHNNFSGDIPTSFSPKLSVLDLSSNSFTGNFPLTIQNLTQLTGLNLQNNSLSGPIPNVTFPRLKHLNLSYNHLNGSIPSSLQTFPNSSFVGNSFLCGLPLNPCSPVLPPPSPSPTYFPPPRVPPKQNSRKKLTRAAIIAIIVGGVLKGKGSTGGRSEKPKEEFGSGVQEPEKNKLVFFEGSSYNFDLDDLLRASAEVLGKGSYGTAYKAVLEESTTVVVKRLKEVVVGKKEFEQQMEIVGRVGQHPNVVPLRAYYYSKDEKLLVYDYFQGGSLCTLLHGSRAAGRTPLDWDSRIKISLGVARAIVHIHSTGGAKFTHGDIKSSNVLLNQDLNGSISDFGLAPLMNFPPTPSRYPGYRAPEVAMAMAAKAKLLLRELKTVKADLAFAKQRCVQLEEENRILRGSLEKGDNLEDDDLIRLQLETLLAEKAQLSQENSVFARENRFLREIVEYHQLTMQDVVYLDEGNEEVTEVYPIERTFNEQYEFHWCNTNFSFSLIPNSCSPCQKSTSDPGCFSSSVTPLSSFFHIPVQEDL